MKKKPKVEIKMLLFRRVLYGFSVSPHSVIAWLYSKGEKKLAEEFNISFNKVIPSLEKSWMKNVVKKDEEIKNINKRLDTKNLDKKIRLNMKDKSKESHKGWKFW